MRRSKGYLFRFDIAREIAIITCILTDSKADRGVGEHENREGFSYSLSGSYWHGEVQGELTRSGASYEIG